MHDARLTPRSDGTSLRFDPLAPDVLPDPYPAYARLRRDDPVHWGMADDAGLPGRWYVTRYDDVVTLLKDTRFGREVKRLTLTPQQPDSDDVLLVDVAKGWMILRDPPVHTRLRGLAQGAYTPRRVAALSGTIERTAHALIDIMQTETQPVDLLRAFALPLTVQMTARVLGLPLHDAGRLATWSRAMAAVIDLNQDEDVRVRSRDAIAEFVDYLHTIIAKRRRVPQDDLISALLTQADGLPALTDEELIGTVTHLLFVGNDPVMHAFGNSMMVLDTHSRQRALLRARPELLPNGVDELMRYDSPVQMTFRYVLEDVDFGGRRLQTGDHVAVVLGSANRDEACCPAADTLDVTRPVGQVAHFGFGIHYCLGAPLARLEIQIGLGALLSRLPELRLEPGSAKWQRTVAVRGVKTLPVRF